MSAAPLRKLRLNQVLGDCAMFQELKVLLLAATVSRTAVAQIQLRIKTRKCAANLVMLVKFFGRQKLPE